MWLDDHVIGLRNADSKFIHRHRLDVLPIGGNYGHLQPWDTHIENCHRSTVDKTQPDSFATLKHSEPPVVGRYTVHQECVGIAGNV